MDSSWGTSVDNYIYISGFLFWGFMDFLDISQYFLWSCLKCPHIFWVFGMNFIPSPVAAPPSTYIIQNLGRNYWTLSLVVVDRRPNMFGQSRTEPNRRFGPNLRQNAWPNRTLLAEPNPSGRTLLAEPCKFKIFFFVFLLKYCILEAFSWKIIGSPNPFAEYLTKPNPVRPGFSLGFGCISWTLFCLKFSQGLSLGSAGLAKHCSVSSSSRVQPWVQLDYLNIVLPRVQPRFSLRFSWNSWTLFCLEFGQGSARWSKHCSALSSAKVHPRVQLD